jgi:LysM repeat protein
MKSHTLPVKRRPVAKGMFKRLKAVTGNRKQRVAATATADMEMEDSGSKISRALTIIFLFHIVAVGLIFVHQKFLDGRSPEAAEAARTAKQDKAVAVPAAERHANLPRLSSNDQAYMVQAGDNYKRIAASLGVDEAMLRSVNQDVEIRPGRVLIVPPKRIVALDPPEVVALRQPPVAADSGLVEAVPVDVRGAPRAQLVRPSPAAAAPNSGKKTYVVQSGDNIWRIANRFGVKQEALMKANGITDARKMKIGTNLIIPE